MLSDAPIGTAVQVEGFNHLLGESGVSFFASKESAARLKKGFPKSLNGQPVLAAERSHAGATVTQPLV